MIKVIGHRGVRDGKGPPYQNTLPAFEEAFKHADGIETDAVVSKDGEVFLIHATKTLVTTFNALYEQLDRESYRNTKNRRIDEMTANDVRALKLKSGEKIPTLRELFELAGTYPGKILNIELKGQNSADAVLKEIDRAVADGLIKEEQVILSSFDHPQLLEVRKKRPGIKLAAIFGYEGQRKTRLHPWDKNSTAQYVPFRASYLDEKLMRDIDPDLFFISAETAQNDAHIEAIKKKFPDSKIMLGSYREKKPAKSDTQIRLAGKLDKAGLLHCLISDYPKDMKAELAKKTTVRKKPGKGPRKPGP